MRARMIMDRVLKALAEKLPKTAHHLKAAHGDILAFTAFPMGLWRQVRSKTARNG